MHSSDLLSAPTNYVLQATKNSSILLSTSRTPQIIMPNSINGSDYHPDKKSRSEAVALFREVTKCPIDENNFNIFIVGSVEKRKGVEIVTKAIEGIVKEIPNAHVYFIGHHVKEDGNSLTANNKLSPESILSCIPENVRQNVHFTDYVDHSIMPELMAAGDVFPICYLGDNFPGVVAEVGLSQRPMIALLRGGIPEMIGKDGQYLAQTIDGSSEEEIASALVTSIKEVRQNPAATKSLESELRQHLLDRFDSKKIAGSMLKEYTSSLSEKQKTSKQASI